MSNQCAINWTQSHFKLKNCKKKKLTTTQWMKEKMIKIGIPFKWDYSK